MWLGDGVGVRVCVGVGVRVRVAEADWCVGVRVRVTEADKWVGDWLAVCVRVMDEVLVPVPVGGSGVGDAGSPARTIVVTTPDPSVLSRLCGFGG